MSWLATQFTTISIHPPRVGWDYFIEIPPCNICVFQSTHPVWGGTPSAQFPACGRCYFNPPTPCGVGRCREADPRYIPLFQSTHPVWGGTPDSRWRSWRQKQFQSTHPVWGGTKKWKFSSKRTTFQSTHPVWGGTDLERMTSSDGRISIHPPRVGWDGAAPFFAPRKERFQSTHPVWGGTHNQKSQCKHT